MTESPSTAEPSLTNEPLPRAPHMVTMDPMLTAIAPSDLPLMTKTGDVTSKAAGRHRKRPAAVGPTLRRSARIRKRNERVHDEREVATVGGGDASTQLPIVDGPTVTASVTNKDKVTAAKVTPRARPTKTTGRAVSAVVQLPEAQKASAMKSDRGDRSGEPTAHGGEAAGGELDGDDDRDPAAPYTLQATDTEIVSAQKNSKFVQQLIKDGTKARPREVIPPLRSIRGGDVGDRWALDVAGPFPIAAGGDRYVIAAIEYVTRYAVACCVETHTAVSVATFLMEEDVLRFGAFRELLTDGAPEMTGEVIDKLVELLQSRQVSPVPYRPQLVGLVERFHRSWKDCVSTFMTEERQDDWNLYVKFAVYAYNSAKHSTVALSPNELMMGRKLRHPIELLRRTEVRETGDLQNYHEQLLVAMERSHECAELARQREQDRQARYYNRKVRQRREFRPGDLVWVHNPPRGQTVTKFVHQWMGPLCVVEPAGYENHVRERMDKTDDQLADEDQRERLQSGATAATPARATATTAGRVTNLSGGDGIVPASTRLGTSSYPEATSRTGRQETHTSG
ncbi:hypothetical protein PR003_g2415 [Phytophthora rubi]|uniref:Integrase catalytic domain-containing protein n=1 Tax=Phytophthora rubi TaxID=129364 RepID=A0A6A4FSS0_9STRA|nr:hypothetical protein PR003_g2415 [Phytophthora rubi]